MALVSDVEWVRAAVKVFAIAIPGHVRAFHNRELGRREALGHGVARRAATASVGEPRVRAAGFAATRVPVA